MSRFDTIKQEIDGANETEPELAKESSDLTERRKKFEADLSRIRKYLSKTFTEMAAILDLVARAITIDINSGYKLRFNNGMVTVLGASSTYVFNDVVLCDSGWKRELMVNIMDKMPVLRKEFESIFESYTTRVANFLKTLPESAKKE